MTILDKILGNARRVRCSECSLAYVPMLEDVPTESGGAVRQFRCSHCGDVTKVAVFSPYGVRLLDQVQEAAGQHDHKLVQKLQKKLQKEVRRP